MSQFARPVNSFIYQKIDVIYKEYTIKWYVNFLIKELNVKTKIKFDRMKPDGVKSKLLDINLARSYGWKAKTSLKIGLQNTIKDFKKKYFK